MNVGMEAPGVGGRLDKLRELMDASLLGGLIITCQENRRYYSGFTATDPMLA